MHQDSPLFKDLSSILYTEEELRDAVAALGRRITHDYQGKAPLMICILKGASVFFTDLIRQIDLPLEIEFMAISSYGASTVSSGEVRMVKDLDRPILGRDVLIVEDIVDSGMTLSFLKRTLTNRGASSLRLVTLLDKPSRRTVPLSVDYSCFQIPDAFVVGYGLDYDEKYRNLPLVGILDPKVYSK
jgi:hypoxanthine phosphoribosyltransferase